jgi:hypothetical protein
MVSRHFLKLQRLSCNFYTIGQSVWLDLNQRSLVPETSGLSNFPTDCFTIWVARFELAISCSQSRRITKLSYTQSFCEIIYLPKKNIPIFYYRDVFIYFSLLKENHPDNFGSGCASASCACCNLNIFINLFS